MKCKNCKYESNIKKGDFCPNCGYRYDGSKSKKFIVFLVLLLIVIIGIITFIIFKDDNITFEDPFNDISELSLNNLKGNKDIVELSYVLKDDYNKGNINADKYIMQYAYSLFEPDKLDSKYQNIKNYDIGILPLMEQANELANSLSDETILYILKKVFLTNFKTKENSSVSGMSNTNNSYSVQKLLSEDNDLSMLTNVILSKSGNFLVYYTKEGKSAITDEYARKIADYLEEIVVFYEQEYGLKYKYSAEFNVDIFTTVDIKSIIKSTVLNKAGIDQKYLKTAMPIYIIDTDIENTNTLGYYVATISQFKIFVSRVYGIFADLGLEIDQTLSTYALPFFVASSSVTDFDNMKLVLSHELFHHYQKYICGNGEYEYCSSGNFTEETTANFVASHKFGNGINDNILNHHATFYSSNSFESINFVGNGYASFVFADNYSNIVPNGSEKLFNSLKSENALNSLYENSSGKYKEVMLSTAKNNLLQNYEYSSFLSIDDGVTIYPPNYQDLSGNDSFDINYSSIHYYYLSTSDFDKENQFIVSSNESNNLTLLLFVWKDGKYQYIYTHNFNKEFVININEFKLYDELVVAIVNSSIENSYNYNVIIDKDSNRNNTINPLDVNLFTPEDKAKNSNVLLCISSEEDESLTTYTFVRVGFGNDNKINSAYMKLLAVFPEDDNSFINSISQKITSRFVKTMSKKYKRELKNVDIMTKESDYEYSVIIRINDKYYDSLKGSFNIKSEDKLELFSAIEEKGLSCDFYSENINQFYSD